MILTPGRAILLAGLLVAAGPALAGEEHPGEEQHGPVLEFGAASEWGVPDGKSSFGPSAAIEFTAIEHWLEIEAGVSRMRSIDGTELEADLVFKKPFQLTKNVEFMVGAGPQWTSSGAVGAVAVLDLMVWVTPQYGWFVQPSYSYAFNRGHDQNAGVTLGLLIALPSK